MSSVDRVMVFIDGSNLFHARRTYTSKTKQRIDIDYVKLVNYLVGQRRLIRATYYCSVPVPLTNLGQRKFLDYLRNNQVKVVEKPLKQRYDYKTGKTKPVEKGVDVALSVDVLSMAWEDAYDVAIIVSGDSDYVGAVKHVMSKGKNVEIASFRDSLSRELRQSGLKTTILDDIISLVVK